MRDPDAVFQSCLALSFIRYNAAQAYEKNTP